MAIEIVSFPINSMVIFHRFLYVYQAGYIDFSNRFSQQGTVSPTDNRCSEHWTIPTSFNSLNLGKSWMVTEKSWLFMAMFLWGYHGLKCRVYTEYTEYTILYNIYIHLVLQIYIYILIYDYTVYLISWFFSEWANFNHQWSLNPKKGHFEELSS